MKIPPIDLTHIVTLLKREGKGEMLQSFNNAPSHNFFIIGNFMTEWGIIINVLEYKLVPRLKKGGELEDLLPIVNSLNKSVTKLTLMVTQVLSFIPGPLGIICSIINAIACFCAGNIAGGVFELLGCIPGAKVGIKGFGKLYTEIGNTVIVIIEKNKVLAKTVRDWENMKDRCKVLSNDLNPVMIKREIEKIQKEINNIKGYAENSKMVRTFDTGPTNSLNFERLRTGSNAKIEKRGINKIQNGDNIGGKGEVFSYLYLWNLK